MSVCLSCRVVPLITIPAPRGGVEVQVTMPDCDPTTGPGGGSVTSAGAGSCLALVAWEYFPVAGLVTTASLHVHVYQGWVSPM